MLAVFLVAAASTALLLRSGLAARLALDVPNIRSLHAQPVPRVGGIVLVGVVLVGWIALPFPSTALALPVLLLGAFSYVDDRRGLPVLARLAIHAIAAAMFLLPLEPAPDYWLMAILALVLVWFTNLYNFMDGMDGLAGGMALIGFTAMGTAALLGSATAFAAGCYCVAAAAAGFLVFNWHPAKIFLGDAGSIPLGFLAGGMGLQGWRDGLWPLWFPLLTFSPFVVDATATLLRRLLRGERVWQAHREHYYQRLVRMGWSHRRTALAEFAVMLAMGTLALLLRDAAPGRQFVGIGVAAVILLALMALVDLRWRRFSAEQAA